MYSIVIASIRSLLGTVLKRTQETKIVQLRLRGNKS